MVTPEEWRALALSMPGAEEKSHFEQPDFRVRNKIFAGLSRDGTEGTLKLSPDAQAVVLDAKPKVFSPASGAWGRSGWTRVRLAAADVAECRMLIAESWEGIAPKTLSKTTAQTGTKAPAKKAAKRAPAKKAAKR